MYNPKRTRNVFGKDDAPFKLSRSKIDDFLKCPHCFYLDRRCGIGQPPSFPFTLNNAVDALLKKEFDRYRAENRPHPLCLDNGVDAVPFSHPNLEDWRANFKGIQYHHKPTNFIITGAIDDVWINRNSELIVVDYKATSTKEQITLEADYRQAYKRQMEIYQWLLRQNGFQVSDTGYFVYCNAITEKNSFDKQLSFDVTLLSYVGDDSWIEPTIYKIQECLRAPSLPEKTPTCDYCKYLEEVYRYYEEAEL